MSAVQYDLIVIGSGPSGQRAAVAAAKMKKMLDESGRQEYKAKLQKQLDDYIAAHK